MESKVFRIQIGSENRAIEFKLNELPNDMKMLCFLAGELSNAASYFTTFANVSKESKAHKDPSKTFGYEMHNSWKPFQYSKRMNDANKVKQFKVENDKSSYAETTKRTKVTTYISKTLNSRQEEVPLVGEFIDCAKAEILHLKNNCAKEMFIKLLKISCFGLPKCHCFSKLPANCLFVKFVNAVEKDMKSNILYDKIKQWFNENAGDTGKDFTIRFRGKETFLYLIHFPILCKILHDTILENEAQKRIMTVHYQSIRLRNVVSYGVRCLDCSELMLDHFDSQCYELFVACCLFDINLSPSMWVLCNVAPVHARETYKLYGMGLGCNTMEGREQKHQQITKYALNTTYQNRWPAIFRYEFIQLIHLRENGFDKKRHIHRGNKYTLEYMEGHCANCGLPSEPECPLCDSSAMKNIYKTIADKTKEYKFPPKK